MTYRDGTPVRLLPSHSLHPLPRRNRHCGLATRKERRRMVSRTRRREARAKALGREIRVVDLHRM